METTKVTFHVHVTCKLRNHKVYIVGDGDALGNWNPDAGVRMHSGKSMYPVWKETVALPQGKTFSYKYITRSPEELVGYETLIENRSVTTSGGEMYVDDGTFGRDGESNDLFVNEGYLGNNSRLLITLGGSEFNVARLGHGEDNEKERRFTVPFEFGSHAGVKTSSVTRVTALVVEDTEGHIEHEFHDLHPEQATNAGHVRVPVRVPDNLSLMLTVFAGKDVVGNCFLGPSSFAQRHGFITTPIIKPKSGGSMRSGRSRTRRALSPEKPATAAASASRTRAKPALVGPAGHPIIGELRLRFTLITPFSAPNISHVLARTYWKAESAMADIGHRGAGSNTVTKDGTENTVRSFVRAAELGAEYVEFDVQLTRDHVPVIFHNFTLPVMVGKAPVDIAIADLTLEQFKNLKPSQLWYQDQAMNKVVRSRIRAAGGAAAHNPAMLKKLTGYAPDALATLHDVFKHTPKHIGFDVEVKYPDLYDEQRIFTFERNFYVDTILETVFQHAGDRRLFFSSFDPDVCLMLSLKQPRYPVMFLTEAGYQCPVYLDPRKNSLEAAIVFARANSLLGIVSRAQPLLDKPELVQQIKEASLLIATWGKENNESKNVRRQEEMQVDAVATDRLAVVGRHIRNNGSKGNARGKSSGKKRKDPKK